VVRTILSTCRTPVSARNGRPQTGNRTGQIHHDARTFLLERNRRTAGLVVELEERPADTEYRTRIIERGAGRRWRRALREVRRDASSRACPVQKHDVAEYIDRDRRLLLPLAVAVLAATLAVFFRRPAGVIIPLGVAGLTVVWTNGIYAWSGHDLNAITALMPPVLLVIALAASVHVYEAWRAGTGRGLDRTLAAVAAIAVPAGLCAVTTAQGFASLAVSDIPAVQQLGMFAAVGTFIAFGLGLTAAPASPVVAAAAGRAGEQRASRDALAPRHDVAASRRAGRRRCCGASGS
jgi:predicted RND superfamily exporter protein